jgi:hypothetical protein
VRAPKGTMASFRMPNGGGPRLEKGSRFSVIVEER